MLKLSIKNCNRLIFYCLIEFMKKRTLYTLIILLLSALNLLRAQTVEELFGLTEIYDVQPDVANCKAGTLKDSEKQAILKELNYIRSIHGLKPVEYRSQ